MDPWIRDTLNAWPNPNFLWFKMTNIVNLHFLGGAKGACIREAPLYDLEWARFPDLLIVKGATIEVCKHCLLTKFGTVTVLTSEGLLFLPTPWMVFFRLACSHCAVCSRHCFCLLLPYCSHNNGDPLMLRRAGLCEIHAILVGCSTQFCAILR